MATRNNTFCKKVAQLVEFAGFGPCSTNGSMITVQAFDAIKRYPVNAKLELVFPRESSFWNFPNMLSPTTRAVCEIIEDSFVKGGLKEPGSNSTLLIASSELPYSVELRYLWLIDAVTNERTVIAMLFKDKAPIWAVESTMDYYATVDPDMSKRVRALAETYLSETPTPTTDITSILHEIVDMVESL